MWYWNKKSNTEAIVGFHDLSECNPIEDDQHMFKTQPTPSGKIWQSDSNGMPVLVDIPSPSIDEQIMIANANKQRLITVANREIAPLADAVDLGIATEDEQRRYNDWRRYRVLLNRVDTTVIPVSWPDRAE